MCLHRLEAVSYTHLDVYKRQHDGGAVNVVGTDEMDFAWFSFILLHSLETDPDIGLNVFHDMSDMKRGIGVWQCSSDKQLS